MLRIYFSKKLLKLNRYLAGRLNNYLYFIFVKFIYPLFLIKPIDFSLQFSHDEEKKFYLVKSNESKNGYYYNIERSNRYIFGGLNGIGKKLYQKYQLEKIKINKGDVVIDIGCNVGELTYYLSKFDPFIYAIDIEQQALDCLKLNCDNYENLKIQRLAIWNKRGYLNFESKLNEASSTLLSPRNLDNKTNLKKINAITLDEFFFENNLDQVKLVKVEAEGGEPEILEGAINSLKKINYITLDCGPERYGATTFEPVIEILKKNNFKVENYKNCCFGTNRSLINENA